MILSVERGGLGLRSVGIQGNHSAAGAASAGHRKGLGEFAAAGLAAGVRRNRYAVKNPSSPVCFAWSRMVAPRFRSPRPDAERG